MIPGLNWLNIGAGAIGAFALSWLLHTVSVGWAEKDHAKELASQKSYLENSCAEDKALTKGANDALQKSVTDITAKLNAAKRLHKPRCVIPVTGDAHTPSSGTGHAGSNGISSDWLREYAAECETYRQQRITLEKFIGDVWRLP